MRLLKVHNFLKDENVDQGTAKQVRDYVEFQWKQPKDTLEVALITLITLNIAHVIFTHMITLIIVHNPVYIDVTLGSQAFTRYDSVGLANQTHTAYIRTQHHQPLFPHLSQRTRL